MEAGRRAGLSTTRASSPVPSPIRAMPATPRGAKMWSRCTSTAPGASSSPGSAATRWRHRASAATATVAASSAHEPVSPSRPPMANR
ncbi:MAG: hypothetical protein AVDCRST_MAG06-1918 [uncultured Nocardioides sp.]|uniref:Uncharacterized protein n=1 Tax=uncultured Nocardioides sp. TaxID=198441 RepID=A0A6J4NUN9_9ACTN|nr:MAG: hypothetical protein AVDCRST_MAG06-1918 [uncultured Nocardioides sp.]